jgi:pheromone shutdown protein TraB
VESNRGFKRLDKRREEHIAKELYDVARYRRKVLAVIEVERVEGVADMLKGVCNNG